MANGPSGEASGSTNVVNAYDKPGGSGLNQPEASASTVDANKNPAIAYGAEPIQGQPAGSSSTSSSSTVCFSSSDPVLVPSNDSRLPGAVGAIKREVGSHRTPSEPTGEDFEILIWCD